MGGDPTALMLTRSQTLSNSSQTIRTLPACRSVEPSTPSTSVGAATTCILVREISSTSHQYRKTCCSTFLLYLVVCVETSFSVLLISCWFSIYINTLQCYITL